MQRGTQRLIQVLDLSLRLRPVPFHKFILCSIGRYVSIYTQKVSKISYTNTVVPLWYIISYGLAFITVTSLLGGCHFQDVVFLVAD
jgi:hypothetical protein